MNQKIKKFAFWGGVALVIVGVIAALVVGIINRVNEFTPNENEETTPVVENLPDGYVQMSKAAWDNGLPFNGTSLDKITTIEFTKKYNGDAEDAWVFDGIKFFQNEGFVYVVVPNTVKILGTMHGTFADMKNLTEIKGLDLVDTSSVQDMGKLFSGCLKLENIDLTQLETDALVNAEYMFENCINIKNYDLSNHNMENLTTAAYMFYNCNMTESIIMPDTPSLMNMSHMFDGVGCSSTNGVAIGGKLNISNCKKLDYTFANTYIMGTDVVQSLDTAHVIDMTGTFEKSCFEKIDLSKWNVMSVEKMDYMFSECTRLKDINVSGWKVPSLKSCERMFYNCHHLLTLNIDWIGVEVIENANSMFRECTCLTEINLSAFNGKVIGDTRWMFSNCVELTKILTTGFDANVSDKMFEWCAKLPNYDEQFDMLTSTTKNTYFTKP